MELKTWIPSGLKMKKKKGVYKKLQVQKTNFSYPKIN